MKARQNVSRGVNQLIVLLKGKLTKKLSSAWCTFCSVRSYCNTAQHTIRLTMLNKSRFYRKTVPHKGIYIRTYQLKWVKMKQLALVGVNFAILTGLKQSRACCAALLYVLERVLRCRRRSIHPQKHMIVNDSAAFVLVFQCSFKNQSCATLRVKF